MCPKVAPDLGPNPHTAAAIRKVVLTPAPQPPPPPFEVILNEHRASRGGNVHNARHHPYFFLP